MEQGSAAVQTQEYQLGTADEDNSDKIVIMQRFNPFLHLGRFFFTSK